MGPHVSRLLAALVHAVPLASGFAVSGGGLRLGCSPGVGGAAPLVQQRGLLLGGRQSLIPMSVSLNRYHKFSDISQGKVDALFEKIEKMGLDLGEIDEKFVRGSGAGGQKINKTSSCVQMTHKPTGLQVSCQHEREREKNRFIALRTLIEKIEGGAGAGEGEMSAAEQAAEKKRKQKARRKRRTSSSKTALSGADGGDDGELSDSADDKMGEEFSLDEEPQAGRG